MPPAGDVDALRGARLALALVAAMVAVIEGEVPAREESGDALAPEPLTEE